MEKENKTLAILSNQELLQEVKKRKGVFIAYCLVIGLLMGVAFYNATHKGSFIFSCLPLFFMAIFISSDKRYREAKKELKARGLENIKKNKLTVLK